MIALSEHATLVYQDVHPTELLDEYLTPEQFLGKLEPISSDDMHAEPISDVTTLDMASVLSIAEMEQLALKRLNPKAISYYASGTDDEITKVAHVNIFKSIILRPKVFVDCTHCSLSTSFIRNSVGLPIFISPAAWLYSHILKARGASPLHAPVSTLFRSSARMHPSLRPEGYQGYRKDASLYQDNPTDKIRRTRPRRPNPWKREADERYKAREVAGESPPQVWGIESALAWEKTLRWLSGHTDLPIVLKGIQTHEDAFAATKFSIVKGIILSNHGGRALDTAPHPIQVLLEIRKFCPQVLSQLDVLIDGGVKRGTDVVKALALGAKGVGLGRAALYGPAGGGEKGVHRSLQILAEETATALRLLGINRVSDFRPRHVSKYPTTHIEL
ncbi:hypothetical protein FSST1_006663 [Fusarium sambucinum]